MLSEIERGEFRKKIVEAMYTMDIATSTCRGCGEPIIWLKNHKGKNIPVDMYLQNHFINCPDRDRFKKPKDGPKPNEVFR
jgi:hypothetical protein